MFEPVRLRSALPAPAALAGLPEQQSPASRSIERLVIGIFWLLVLEGALRKWVLPSFSQYLFFIRDPLVLLVYWRAFRSNNFNGREPLLQIGLGFAAAALLLAFVQSISFGDSRLFAVVVYGWRQYFLYLPLPFIMAVTFNGDSMRRFARHAFIAAIIMAPVVLLQVGSSPSSVINRGISDEAALQFQSFAYTGGKIRPSGTFTSTVGVKELIPSTLALLLGLWLTPPKMRRVSFPMLVIAAGALATCLALCGSRAAFVHTAFVMLSSLLLAMVARKTAVRSRALLIPVVLLGLGVLLYPIVFPDALHAMLNRVAEAHASESRFSSLGIFGRALYETIDFVNFMQRTPIFGFGLGLGGNGRTYLGNSDPKLTAMAYAESDWSRHIVDLGSIVGVLFIIYRIAFTITIFVRALHATRLTSDPFPLLLFGYVGIGLFYGQLTGHGTVGGFLWLFLGLCMASCRIASRVPHAVSRSAQGVYHESTRLQLG